MLDDAQDLVALHSRKHTDALSTLVLNWWPGSAHNGSGHTEYVHERKIAFVVSILSTLIAAVLLVGSILTLYFVTEPSPRLALVIMFIMLFAAGIRFTTSAIRDSIFAATAAYAAVLVVFVSGDLGNAQGGSPD